MGTDRRLPMELESGLFRIVDEALAGLPRRATRSGSRSRSTGPTSVEVACRGASVDAGADAESSAERGPAGATSPAGPRRDDGRPPGAGAAAPSGQARPIVTCRPSAWREIQRAGRDGRRSRWSSPPTAASCHGCASPLPRDARGRVSRPRRRAPARGRAGPRGVRADPRPGRLVAVAVLVLFFGASSPASSRRSASDRPGRSPADGRRVRLTAEPRSTRRGAIGTNEPTGRVARRGVAFVQPSVSGVSTHPGGTAMALIRLRSSPSFAATRKARVSRSTR